MLALNVTTRRRIFGAGHALQREPFIMSKLSNYSGGAKGGLVEIVQAGMRRDAGVRVTIRPSSSSM